MVISCFPSSSVRSRNSPMTSSKVYVAAKDTGRNNNSNCQGTQRITIKNVSLAQNYHQLFSSYLFYLGKKRQLKPRTNTVLYFLQDKYCDLNEEEIVRFILKRKHEMDTVWNWHLSSCISLFPLLSSLRKISVFQNGEKPESLASRGGWAPTGSFFVVVHTSCLTILPI